MNPSSRPQGFLQRRQRVVGMHLIQVNRLAPQPAKRGIQRAGQVARGQPGAVRRVIHRQTALGGQHHALGDIGRAAGEPAADDLLRPPAAVYVGRVHHRAARLDEEVELLMRPGLVGLDAERHRSQAQARHRAATASQHAIVHKTSLSRPGAPQQTRCPRGWSPSRGQAARRVLSEAGLTELAGISPTSCRIQAYAVHGRLGRSPDCLVARRGRDCPSLSLRIASPRPPPHRRRPRVRSLMPGTTATRVLPG